MSKPTFDEFMNEFNGLKTQLQTLADTVATFTDKQENNQNGTESKIDNKDYFTDWFNECLGKDTNNDN